MRNRSLWLILAFALLLRGGLLALALLNHGQVATPDSEDYTTLAATLAQRGAFKRAAWWTDEPQPEIFRTPGYPLFLAATTLGGRLPWQTPLVVQVLVSTATVGLTFSLGCSLGARRLGLAAALLQAVAPPAIAASCRLLSETLYTFLFIAACLLAVRYLHSRRFLLAPAAAALMAAATYVRPAGQLTALLLLPAFVWPAGRIKAAGAYVLVLVALLAPWVARNAVRADYTGFSSFAKESMVAYTVPAAAISQLPLSTKVTPENMRSLQADSRRFVAVLAVDARFQHAAPEDRPQWEYLLFRLHNAVMTSATPMTRAYRGVETRPTEFPDIPPLKGVKPGEIARASSRLVAQTVSDHPATAAKSHLKGSAPFWLPGATDVLETAGVSRGQRGTLAVIQTEGLWAGVRHYLAGNVWLVVAAIPLVLLYAIRMLGVLLGLVFRLRWRHLTPAVVILTVIVVLTSLLGGPASTPRFRVPVAPLLGLAAAAGYLGLHDRLRRRRNGNRERETA